MVKSGGVKTRGSKNVENRKNKKERYGYEDNYEKEIKIKLCFCCSDFIYCTDFFCSFLLKKRKKMNQKNLGIFERKGIMSPKSIWCAVQNNSYSAPACPQNKDTRY